ncbi:2-aminomuconate deaminase OS=Castellaniella defragrans OX=75697 GN=HNR28_003389 PE=4 SV=1 [Castellaniella defragrans]
MTGSSKHADIAQPLAGYAPFRRAGDLVFFAGILAADVQAGRIITGYRDLPEHARAEAGETGELSSDEKEGPIAAQSWYVLDALRRTVASAGGTLDDVVNLTQYFTDLRDYPIYARIRAKFFSRAPASTCVRVLELLPTTQSRLEVQAIAHIPQR